ncbi:OLC1v1012890C1 [Oldenlandia corymbosa var. corymbosa]|uniref:OLC1v1012890C1 n=1 Tax=Oldenlandia corymbosa var. corymbosa TaxID=529605 RepID=A0AAV1DX27_OLDCO|nr:OLC1v1012890C1 [Oldenlandia corymbosa var. corymbosa]
MATTTKHTISKKCHISTIEQQQPQPKSASSFMDPTVLKSNSSTAKPHAAPPDAATTTIQNISNRFAKLYANHKIHAPSKGSSGLRHSISRFQEMGQNDSRVLDNSSVALTKSNSQRGRNVVVNGVADLEKEGSYTRTKVREKDKKSVVKKTHLDLDVEKAVARKKFNELKTLSAAQKEEKKEPEYFFDGDVVKEESALMSNCQEGHELKKFNPGIELNRPSISLSLNGGRRRKSFCCSQTELADFLSCAGVKVVAVDMPPFMQIHAVDCARKTYDSLEKFTSKTLAFTLKKEFDGVYGPAWHCIVGTSFGSFVTHSVGGFMYFSMDHKLYILMFKTTVQRAD